MIEGRVLRALKEIVNDTANEGDYALSYALDAIVWQLEHTQGLLAQWLAEAPPPRGN